MVFMIRLMKQEHLGTEVFRHGLQLEEERLVEALRYAKKHMLKHFGRLDPRYGQVMRHRRGDKDLALWGFPDVMGAMLGKFEADGRLKGRRGESHIILARLSEEGVQLRAVNEYGTSNKPGSPHYSDQMELFANQETRPVTMKREALERNAERIYHPGESAPAE
jgi:acyl-homoserine-lactone acylase